MAKGELVTAIQALTAERDLPVEVVIDAVQNALAATYQRQHPEAEEIRVDLETETGEFHVFAQKRVVIEPRDEENEISLKDAQLLGEHALDEMVEVEVTPENFGRIAAQTAKQTILQRIQEAERDLIYDEYADREGEIVNGVIERIEQPRGIMVNLGKAEALLPPIEQVRNERYRIGQRLKVYVQKVDRGIRTPQLIVSRANRGLVRRLFEVEVPEIFSGTVELKAIAREPGSRTKVAVVARQQGLDAVGACVGMRGVRIQNVVNELNGEKIDVVQWDENSERFVANALSPAQVLNVEIVEADRRAIVTVPDGQLSLAIGKEGQNARLAAKLTGWRVDIKKQTDVDAGNRPQEPEPAVVEPVAVEPAVQEDEAVTMEELLEQVPVEAGDEG
ncbi:MAG: transcription termination factor NusA [Chloroflexota bacterium]